MIKLGTRASPLAMAQAQATQQALMKVSGEPESFFPLVAMTSSGDKILDRPLMEAGGKGLFAKELESALLNKQIDIAVHSAKDMETFLPDGLELFASLPRESPYDALIANNGYTLKTLPHRAKVGTASRRREALLRCLRPDLNIDLIRGNIQTRLKRVKDGEFSATLLAVAGLNRAQLHHHITEILPPETFTPAAGQGIIALEIREGDEATKALLQNINDPKSWIALKAERSFLAIINGSCQTPIGAYCTFSAPDSIKLEILVLTPDGTFHKRFEATGKPDEAQALGFGLGRKVLASLTDAQKALMGLNG